MTDGFEDARDSHRGAHGLADGTFRDDHFLRRTDVGRHTAEGYRQTLEFRTALGGQHRIEHLFYPPTLHHTEDTTAIAVYHREAEDIGHAINRLVGFIAERGLAIGK